MVHLSVSQLVRLLEGKKAKEASNQPDGASLTFGPLQTRVVTAPKLTSKDAIERFLGCRAARSTLVR